MVVGAIYRAMADGGDLSTATLLEELEATVPLSVSRKEEVARLRAWGNGRAVVA